MKDIILTGPKHCGKTSAAVVLASLFSGNKIDSCRFIDLDDLITQKTGKTPRELFCESPKAFQEAEARAIEGCLLETDTLSQRVIAAGGGIIDNHEAAAILKKSDAIKIYLEVPAETAWQRIAAVGELPPFLKTDNPKDNPQETHRVLHERRAAAYVQLADIVIKAEGKTSECIANEIYQMLALSIAPF